MSNDPPPPAESASGGTSCDRGRASRQLSSEFSSQESPTERTVESVASAVDVELQSLPQQMSVSQVAELLDALNERKRFSWFDWMKDLAIPILALAVGAGVGLYAAASQAASQLTAAQSSQRETAYATFMEAEDKINVAFLRIQPHITRPQYFESSNVKALLDEMTAARASSNTASQAVLLVGSDDILPKRKSVIDYEQQLCDVVYRWRDEAQAQLRSGHFSQFLDTNLRFSELLDQRKVAFTEFGSQARADVSID